MLLRLPLLIALLSLALPAHAATQHPDPHAQALYESARRRLATSTIESRRAAIRELEQATMLDRNYPECELLLARTYYQAGFLKQAQRRFERVSNMAPTDPDGRYGLGQIWRRDWIKYLERRSLDRAIDNFSVAAEIRPAMADAWIQLVPLLIERHDLSVALEAGRHAVEADPQRPDAVLALAHASFRNGRVHEADSLFRLSIPRLPRLARLRFDDISPVATERDTAVLHRLAPPEQRAFVEMFWGDIDPDLTSFENEARLEYWSRVSQAYFLYFNSSRREWDERGELYVRYGPPDYVVYNPFNDELTDEPNTDGRVRFGPGTFRFIDLRYPMNVMKWRYRDLGLTVRLEDRTLTEFYLLPVSMALSPDPVPDPDSLEAHAEDLPVAGGRGVFPRLPPGVHALPVTGHVARFAGAGGPRLMADIEMPAAPSDRLTAEWVVLDSSHVEVARGTRSLSPSACDPSEVRVADFAKDLAPGRYMVGIAVHDSGSGRGVYRTEVELTPDSQALAMSDVVVSCGTPLGSGPDVRIEPNARGHVAPGGPLTAYFEVYHLAVGAQGESRFEYECIVRSLDRDPRVWVQRVFAPRPRVPEISTRREDGNVGSLRRQFVSVPVASLPPGRYRLEIKVRDLVAGATTGGEAPFVKLAGTATPTN